jgi:diaminopimelate decarboxylase
MYYGAYHRIENISKPDATEKPYDVVGYLCETDTFASNRNVGQIEPADILAFHNAGAYCYMMASNYNSRVRPAEVLIHAGKDYLIRRREVLDDILRTEVMADL